MKSFSQRRMFTMLMTLCATLTGIAFGLYDLRFQPDFITDVVKICGLLSLASLCVSYTMWTVTHLKKESVFRGGLAGLLTGLAIVPVPYFTWTLKTEFFRLYASEKKGVLMSVLEAMPLSIQTGLETFLIISKVSLFAVISSVILGVIIAKWCPSSSILGSNKS